MFPSTTTFTDFYMKKERTVTEPLLTASINTFPDQLQHLDFSMERGRTVTEPLLTASTSIRLINNRTFAGLVT